jgi:hypothetical protein
MNLRLKLQAGNSWVLMYLKLSWLIVNKAVQLLLACLLSSTHLTFGRYKQTFHLTLLYTIGSGDLMFTVLIVQLNKVILVLE